MSPRGGVTRERLLAATVRAVAEHGYAGTTTRVIAELAGVAEGTIYRHFPTKASLFHAAVLDSHRPVVSFFEELPGRAGAGSLEATLVEALEQLAALREAVVPLELAMLADRELAPDPGLAAAASQGPAGPPELLTAYLAAEQERGRVRPDVDPHTVALLLMATLFGLAVAPPVTATGAPVPTVADAVRVVLSGIAAEP